MSHGAPSAELSYYMQLSDTHVLRVVKVSAIEIPVIDRLDTGDVLRGVSGFL